MSFDVCPASDLVTQGFGCTDFTSEWIAAWCPSKRYHSGIDLGMRVGSLYHQPVFATRAGTIVAVGMIGDVDWGFWNYLGNQAVCLKTHDAFILHAHLYVASVHVGQTVQVGEQIGLVGTRGNSTGPHLHVEVRTDGARQNVWNNAAAVLDPRPYLNKLAGATAGSEVRVPQEENMTGEDLVRIWYWIAQGHDPSPEDLQNDVANLKPGSGPGRFAQILASPEAKAHWASVVGAPAPPVDISTLSPKGHTHLVQPDV